MAQKSIVFLIMYYVEAEYEYVLMNKVGVTGRTDLGPEYVGGIFSGSL